MRSIYFKSFLIVPVLIFSCTNNKEKGNSDTIASDSTQIEIAKTQIHQDVFEGEYLIGDGGAYIVPVNGTYELRDSRGKASDVFYFNGKENDTISTYANSAKTVFFKMFPGHKSGMYYEPDEKWPVSYVGPVQKEETEEEETARIFRERHFEDSIAYSGLGVYDGTYSIKTESDGVNATLKLHYNGDQTFNYEWSFEVSSEETNCNGKRKGVLAMDKTQHGFYGSDNCKMHFNFNGFQNNSYIVEIDFEDQAKCTDLKGDCIFSGTYLSNK